MDVTEKVVSDYREQIDQHLADLHLLYSKVDLLVLQKKINHEDFFNSAHEEVWNSISRCLIADRITEIKARGK